MAALPVNSTSRLVVDYTWRGFPYTTLYRFGTEIGQSSAIGAINIFHAAIDAAMTTEWTVPGSAVWYAALDNFGDDVSVTANPSGAGGATNADYPDSLQYQVVGRSAGGRKVSWYLQGAAIEINPEQRVLAGDEGAIDAILDAFGELVGEGLTSINGLAPVIKPYINIVFNDYLTRKARTGG